MKIFITGTNGFVGKNLCEFYSDHEVCKFTRDMDLVRSLDHFKPDLIINSAADIYDADKMYQSNVHMVKVLLDYVKEHPNTQMIQLGSSSEYGPLPRAANENDKINPIDMYQATKGMATIMCQGYAKAYDLNVSIARLYSVYGKYEKPHRLFPRMWKAFQLDQPVKLFQGYHDFIFIEDLLRGIDILIKNGNKGDIVNFGSGAQTSNFEIYDLFKKITNKEAPVEKINQTVKKFETSVWLCDTSYAYEKYNFKTEVNLENGIKKFLETATYEKENI